MQRFRLLTLSAAAIGLLIALAGAVAAQTPAPPPPTQSPGQPPTGQPRETLRDRFSAANTTHDGCLTLAQAQVADLRPLVRNFPRIDTAHRGCITLPQIRAFNQAQRAARTQPPPAPPMAGSPGAPAP